MRCSLFIRPFKIKDVNERDKADREISGTHRRRLLVMTRSAQYEQKTLATSRKNQSRAPPSKVAKRGGHFGYIKGNVGDYIDDDDDNDDDDDDLRHLLMLFPMSSRLL